MKEISVHEFKALVHQKGSDTSLDFVNVCSPAEYKEQHIQGVRNVPLDTLKARVGEFSDKKQVYIHCRSGRRGATAIETLRALGVQAELINVSGGLLAWNEAGLPTQALTNRMPIMRQVLMTAGLLVVLGVLLGYTWHEGFYSLAFFVGAGLTFAGVTGWCGMSKLLAVMPWNK